MYSWCIKTALITSLFLSALVFSQNSTEIRWRTIYIIPEDISSLFSCPMDYCYSLQNVLSNSSYFFDSNTTLELLPGVYNITENVGQLVLVNVENFTLRGSSPNVNITCQSRSSFGLTVIQGHNIEISNIQISHCSAKLLLEESNNPILTNYYSKKLGKVLNYNLSICDAVTNGSPACYTFFASFESKNVTIYETAILNSNGVGIFSLGDKSLHISSSLLAYNQINCIAFTLSSTRRTRSTFNISQSQVKFGQMKSHSFKFAAGLNLFVRVSEETHSINLTDITLRNNGGTYGNLYMEVSALSSSYNLDNIRVNIQFTNVMSIQSNMASFGPYRGLVVKYKIQLSHFERSSDRESWPLDPDYYPRFSREWLARILKWGNTNFWRKRVNIVLENGYFVGSCLTIMDSVLSMEGSSIWFLFAMKNITIIKSRCPMALSIVDSDLNSNVQLSDLTIINSRNDILLLNIASETSKLILTGNTSFSSNQGSVLLISGVIKLYDIVLISSNTARNHESIFQVSDSSQAFFKGEIMFTSNTGRQGGAISAYSSNLTFDGSIHFIGNSAEINGGAITLKEEAVINVKKRTSIIFQANIADKYGGAIYVEDAGFLFRMRIKCFVSGKNGYIKFENNTAGIAGADLFGGWIDLCGINIFDFQEENNVASAPTGVFMCTNSTLNRYKTEAHIRLFPGQTFEIEVVAVGQRFGVVPASVRADSNAIDQLQKLQDTQNHCTKLKFTVQSSNKNETIALSIDGRIIPRWVNQTIPDEFLRSKVFVALKNCPLGFEFDTKRNICSCHPYLVAHGVQCNYSTFELNRKAQQWIGVLNPTNYKTIVIHQHCPYDYCKPHALSLNLSVPDKQCSSNRSGILCGACQPGLSQVLGTSNCKKCSNVWILLILVFAFAGVLLVAGLIKLNITVSMGTINGLIFYVNIVRANTATFFPDKTANTFLNWFIAWLNLDVGIEICFYDGLNAYMKTWLQFAFPLYIWFLATVIIISSRYSKRAANAFGVNAVQVLATLFLLSYAKLLRVTITVFQPTRLVDNYNVWHYDGNIGYLRIRHAVLMLAALLFFAFFLLPYTLILFGIQWLQIFSHYKPFRWVNKLKPLYDAYTGPYKDKHRYWTGLLLLVRIGLFIVFSANTSGDPAINLLAIIIVVICLFVYLAVFGGVYKNCPLNLLEYSSLLNLVILSVAMLYTTSADKQSHSLSQVSVSITLSTTMLIVVYHSLVVILKAIKMDSKVKAFWRSDKTDSQLPKTTDEMQQHSAVLNPPVTCSVIELTEPFLEYP